MEAFTLYAKLVLDSEEFDTAIGKKESNSKKWGAKLGALAGKAFAEAFKVAKDIIEKGMDFDEMMSAVKAVTDTTDEEFDQLRNKALELGRSTKFTATEVAEGLYYMGLAGWDAQESLAGIGPVLELAAAAGEDLGTTSSIVVDGMTAFGLSADRTQHFVDVLAAAATNSNTTVSKMGETFKNIAPIAGSLGMTVDDVALGIGLLANNGIKGAQAGTALRNVIQRLAAPSKAASKELAKLGISLTDPKTGKPLTFRELIDSFRGLSGMKGANWKDIREQIDALDENAEDYEEQVTRIAEGSGDFLTSIVKVTGARALPAFLALMSSSDKDLNDLADAIANSEGAAGQMSQTMLDNLKGDVTILNSAIEGLQILVSDEYKGKLREFTQFLTEQVGKMGDAFSAGGLTGMFVNLTNWMIDGITDALTDDSITVEGANEFGEGLGTFIGNLISKLVQNGGAILGGLFEAGVNLAGGLLNGLVYGLFGGADEADFLINGILDDENKAIVEAEANATKARGLLNYLDTLQATYGDAAKNTGAWKTAMGELETVMPGITTLIQDQAGALLSTNSELQAYIQNTLDAAKQQAKQKAVQELADAYTAKTVEQATAELGMEIEQSKMDEATRAARDLARKIDPNFNPLEDYGYELNAREMWAHFVDSGNYELSEEQRQMFEAYKKTYNESERSQSELAETAATAAKDADALAIQLDLTSRALARLEGSAENAASSADNFGGPAAGENATSHASGLNYVPYDDYLANLHRGEMVLTASQARNYREGNGGLDMGQLYAAVASAVAEAVSNIQINMDGESVGNAVASTVDSAIGREANSARYSV